MICGLADDLLDQASNLFTFNLYVPGLDCGHRRLSSHYCAFFNDGSYSVSSHSLLGAVTGDERMQEKTA
jgi:hypothetical protein